MKYKITNEELTREILDSWKLKNEISDYLYASRLKWDCDYRLRRSIQTVTFEIMDILRDERERISKRTAGSYPPTLTSSAIGVLSEELTRSRNQNKALRTSLNIELFQKQPFILKSHVEISTSNMANTILDQPVLAKKVFNLLNAVSTSENAVVTLTYDIDQTVEEIMDVLRENYDLIQSSIFGLYGKRFNPKESMALSNEILRLRVENIELAQMKRMPEYFEMKLRYEGDERYNVEYYDSDEF